MLKKFLAALATMALALGMVAATATSASAHHNTIEPSISCNATNFTYDVTWSVTNSEHLTETITSSSDTTLVAVGTSFGDREVKTFTESFAAPVNKTLTLSAKWSNNNTNTSSGQIKKQNFPNCTPQHVPVTFCHATPPDNPNKFEVIKTDDDGALGHAAQHDKDIIPAFTYWTKDGDSWVQVDFPGKNLATDFGGYTGAQILAADCELELQATPPTFDPAVCTAPGVAGVGHYTIPTVAGVKYSVRLNNSGGYVEKPAGMYALSVGTYIQVKAESTLGWVELQDPKSWSFTFVSPGDCIVTTAPVAPSVSNINECGVYGSVVPTPVAGVVYSFTIGDGTEGTWQITATPATGYKFTGAQSVTFDGNVGKYTSCATPLEPKFTDAECTGPGKSADGSYTIYETEGVQYQVKIGDDPYADVAPGTYYVSVFPNTVMIKAIALENYTVTDYTGPWSHTFESAGDCLVLASPVEPVVTSIKECGVYGSVVPKDTLGVVYELTAGDGMSGAYTITATPASGYFFEGAQVVEFSGDLGEYTDCVSADPVVFSDSECAAELPPIEGPNPVLTGFPLPAFFTIPNSIGVEYSVSINGGAFSVYAPGDYEVADLDHVVVTASALGSNTLEGTSEWEHTFAALGVCDLPTKAEVLASASFTNATCAANGSITVVPAEHVLYFIDGVEVTQAVTPKPTGSYVVTAATDSIDYTIIDTKLWNFDITAAAGCGLVLASTGAAAPFLGLWLASGLLLMGAIALVLRRRNDSISE